MMGNETVKDKKMQSAAYVPENNYGYGFATLQNPSWNLAQVLEACDGSLVSGSEVVTFRAVSTDTRTLEPGDLFVALDGEQFDGHRFVEEGVRRGAAGVVVSRELARQVPVATIRVEDSLKALGDLAAYRRRLIPKLEVAAITGSCGKTTVKEMVAAILGRRAQVLKTKGNFNNLIGLPLSLLPVSFHHRYAVLEMGMNRPGEISRLAQIANPDVSCITTIQQAHLEGLGSMTAVARAKAELFSGTSPSKTLAVNHDEARLRKIASKLSHQQISFGLKKGASVRATHVRSRGLAGLDYTVHVGGQKCRIHSRLVGRHNVANGLAAAAICLALGISLEQIAAGLSEFSPPDKRMQLSQLACGIVLLNDSYNANPGSMQAALTAVQDAKREGGAVAVLGDMLELGKGAAALHEKLGAGVCASGFDYLFLYGDFAGHVAAGAREMGMPKDNIKVFASKREIVARLRQMIDSHQLGPGDWILVKGSRGMRMEEITESLTSSE
jgi:UDP-N-acetylmuramoyl-tripeptide--D-alanyl-D-alanine ligase